MKRIQAYKFDLMPDGQQQNHLRRFAGSCRFVFNRALALQKERYEKREKKLGYAGLCKLLTERRNSQETAWLADAPVHPLQQSLKNLERAYANFDNQQPHLILPRRTRIVIFQCQNTVQAPCRHGLYHCGSESTQGHGPPLL